MYFVCHGVSIIVLLIFEHRRLLLVLANVVLINCEGVAMTRQDFGAELPRVVIIGV